MRDYSILLFKSLDQCVGLLDDSKRYYESAFDDLCGRDEWVANYVKDAINANKYFSNGESGDMVAMKLLDREDCHSGEMLMTRFYAVQRAEGLKAPALAVFSILCLLIYVINRRLP